MKAAETQLRVLFDGQKQYLIPLFQRTYAWGPKNWETWWSDILETYNDQNMKGHFIGAIVSKALPHTPEGVSRFLVIDGQQRLTTAAILLSAIRDAARTKQQPLAERIQQVYLTNPQASGENRHKLVPTQADRAEYYLIESGGSSRSPDSNIAGAFAFFARKVARSGGAGPEIDLERLEQTVLNGLETVSVTLEEPDDEYRIFESLNATGARLTQADLIRNYVFMRVPADQQEVLYNEVWMPLQTALGGFLESFFRHAAMSRGQFVRDNDVYSTWKKRFSTLSGLQLTNELTSLAALGKLYKKLLDPSQEPSVGIRNGLEGLNRLGMSTSYPFLLRVYGEYSNGSLTVEEFAMTIRLIESFFVRRMFLNTPTNDLNRLFTRLREQMPAGTAFLEALTLTLSEPGKRWPSDDLFAEAILRYPIYTDSRGDQRRLVLERVEENLEGKERVSLSDLELEHIMPQTLSTEWEAALGPGAVETHLKLVHVLGNLTLTGYNPELSNSPFEVKRRVYGESPLALNRELAESTDWGADEIDARGRRLANLACRIWPGPSRTSSP